MSFYIKNGDSSVSVMTRLQAGQLGFISQQGHGFVLIVTTSTQSLIQWV